MVHKNYRIGSRIIINVSPARESKLRKRLLYASIGIVVIGFAFISLLFQQHELSTVDKTRTISEVHEKIQETITYLKANPMDGRALKSLGALYSEAGLYKEAVSAYISASRELPQDREIQRAFIDLRARGHASSN